MDFERVGIGGCRCPGTPHPDGDEVALLPRLGLSAGVELQQRFRNLLAQDPRPAMPEIVGQLTEGYLLVGVAEWNLAGDNGPIAVTRDAIREHLLSDFSRAQPVADRADSLYYGPVLAPLVAGLSNSLLGTRTSGSTSATKPSSQKPRKRSKRSSTSITRTGATATTTG